MTATVKEIVEAKRLAGKDAYLLLWADSRCYLFGCADTNAIGRWDLDDIERGQLIETGLVDCLD
jgi:hypothetical protein